MDVMVIVVVYAAFGLTISEVKIKIMFTAIFSVEEADQVYHQKNELVYLGGISSTMSTFPLRSIGACATHSASFGRLRSNSTSNRALFSSSKSEC